MSARHAVAAEVLASRDAIESDLELVAYEPRWTQPKPGWRRLRLEAVHAILALTGPLLLSADRSPNLSAEFSRRLREVANTSDDAEPAQTVAAHETDRAQMAAVRTLLDQDFRRLELALEERDAPI